MRIFLHKNPFIIAFFLILTLSGSVGMQKANATVFNTYDEVLTTTAGIIKCYPNPASSYINFSFEAPFTGQKYRLLIYSFTGKKMTDINVSSSTVRVDLSSYFRGVYIYQLLDGNSKSVDNGKFQVVN